MAADPGAPVHRRGHRGRLYLGAVYLAGRVLLDPGPGRPGLRSCGNGSKGPRFADWALLATSSPQRLLLIRRLISRPDNLTFYLCWAPEGTPATMTYFITIAGRRWPEETFKTGKDVLGWDQAQARIWDGICRHTALAALAQLRRAPVRNHLCGDITLPAPRRRKARRRPRRRGQYHRP